MAKTISEYADERHYDVAQRRLVEAMRVEGVYDPNSARRDEDEVLAEAVRLTSVARSNAGSNIPTLHRSRAR